MACLIYDISRNPARIWHEAEKAKRKDTEGKPEINKEKSTEDTSQQGLSNCGTCTTGSTPATVQWYMGFVRKKSKDEKATNVIQ